MRKTMKGGFEFNKYIIGYVISVILGIVCSVLFYRANKDSSKTLAILFTPIMFMVVAGIGSYVVYYFQEQATSTGL